MSWSKNSESLAGSITAADVEKLAAQAAVIGSSLRGEVGRDVIGALKEKDPKVILTLRLADLRHTAGKDDAAARKHLEAAIKLAPTNAIAETRPAPAPAR